MEWRESIFLTTAKVSITMEPMSLFSSSFLQRGPALRRPALLGGPALLGSGLLIVVLAQFWPGWPVVTGIALVGWGALVALNASPRSRRQDSLSMVNLTVYSSLGCLAIVAQSHAVLRQGADSVSPAMLFDHAAAIVLMLGLAAHVVRRLSQPLAEER